MTSSTEDFHGYAGALSTQDAADGSDFFGTDGPKYAVLETSDVDDSDVVLSRGLEESQGITDNNIFPNVPLIGTTTASGVGSSRTTQVMVVYTGGVARDFSSTYAFLGTHLFESINTTSTTTVNGITVPINRVQTSAANNTVEGAFNIKSYFLMACRIVCWILAVC